MGFSPGRSRVISRKSRCTFRSTAEDSSFDLSAPLASADLIMERGGFEWWSNLDEALARDGRYVDPQITYFDPPKEHVAVYNLPSHGPLTGVRQVAPQAASRGASV